MAYSIWQEQRDVSREAYLIAGKECVAIGGAEAQEQGCGLKARHTDSLDQILKPY